jgi:cytochrome P450
MRLLLVPSLVGQLAASYALHLSPPPGPRTLPFVASGWALLRAGDLESLCERCGRLYGPISRVRCPRQDLWIVTSPDLVRDVTVVQGSRFPDRELSSAPDSAPGIVAARGSAHATYRSALNPPYFSPAAVNVQLDRTLSEAQGMLEAEGVDGVRAFLTPTGAARLVPFSQRLALKIQYRSLFNLTLPDVPRAPFPKPQRALGPRICASVLVAPATRAAAHISVSWAQVRAACGLLYVEL